MVTDRPRSDLSGLTQVSPNEFEQFIISIAEPDRCERHEWRRPGTLIYSRMEIILDGKVIAAHDDDGNRWVRKDAVKLI